MLVHRLQLGAWDPIKEIEKRMVDLASDWDLVRARRQWVPPINLWTQNQTVHLQLLVPGYHKENIDVQVEEDVLTVSGTEVTPAEGTRFLKREIETIGFERKIKLPFRVDVSQTKAHLENGVLDLVLERDPVTQPQKIAIGN